MCLGIPGQVIETYQEHGLLMAKIDFHGVSKRACVEHVADVQPGDYVLVHVGFALARVREAEAKQVFELLAQLNQLDEISPGQAESGIERGETQTRGQPGPERSRLGPSF